MSTEPTSEASALHDLQHFLRLALAQLRHRMKNEAEKATYSARMNQMRMLEELIKEQAPNENSSSATRSPR